MSESAWKHEREFRVFSRSQYVPVRLRQLFLGVKMPGAQRTLIKRFLRKMSSEIEVNLMKRGDLDAQELSDII